MTIVETAIKKIKSLPENKVQEVLIYIDKIEKNTTFHKPSVNELKAMANDPDIQKEITKISQEFIHTNLDGLENY